MEEERLPKHAIIALSIAEPVPLFAMTGRVLDQRRVPTALAIAGTVIYAVMLDARDPKHAVHV